ncbi:hypothetical protein BU24DRAFT_494430 [Aaosphaeria arxii CBS 175.79]|uniref:Uncharacterized protein n=1 Tax=Aaosphaeria arxii CBS 175.79 TaxID=1450172 RepID=A0A6A5XMF5_9PLEO|nr:uncharacterized protein BU24DRAFT_494430 [Aaosphaeria arxii CBS 175.79]KAF2014086.1 hypothetical protein BU24DRAFT_494430 [Aaosphaeria arxii CBS 175.79]
MDLDAVSNDFMRHGRCSPHPCARCVGYWAGGNYRFLMKCGCVFPNPEEDQVYLYDAWSEEMDDGKRRYFRRCLRCCFKGQSCHVIPESFDSEVERVCRLLPIVSGEKTAKRVTNPDYDPKDPASLKVIEKDITMDERIRMDAEMRNICQKITRKLNSDYSPHADHLALHNGTFDVDASPQSDLRAKKRERGKKDVLARQEAGRRMLDSTVDDLVKQASPAAGPAKRKRTGGRFVGDSGSVASRIRDLKAQHAVLVALRADTPRNARKDITARIKAVEKEIKAAEKEL